MARSSRHRSSKHRDGREYLDSERGESKRTGREEGGSSSGVKAGGKEAGSGEKRSNDYAVVDEYSSSSKRRKEDETGSKKPSGRRREESSGDGGGKSKEKESDKSRKDDSDRVDKKVFGDNGNSEPNRLDSLQSPEADNQPGRRNKKKRDGYDNADKHQNDEFESNDRRLSSRENRQKDEKYRERYRDDVGRGVRHGDDKQRVENTGIDYSSRRYDEKHMKDDHEALEVQQRDRGRRGDRDREYDFEREHHRDAEFYHDRGRERDRAHYRNRNRSHDNDHDYDWDWEHDQDKDRDNDRKVDLSRVADRDGSHLGDKSTQYKDRRGKKRSPDDWDDFDDGAPVRSRYSDREKRFMKSGRVESDAERGRSQLATITSNRRRNSPTSGSHVGSDEHRHLNSEGIRYRDSGLEHRQKSRDASGYYGAPERVPKYRSRENSVKIDDGHLATLSSERSALKASPIGLLERSSATSAERRHMNRAGARQSLDVEETVRRDGAFDGRDYSANEDRFGWDVAPEKPSVDESSQADLAFYCRSSQGHPLLNAQPSAFRAGIDSPSRGSLDENSRVSNSAPYRRSSDPHVGRGPGNSWRGVPNWPSPVPNGFLPFQHGPPHGGFQTVIPQFPAPPIFGVRPSVDVSHSGFPYHLSDAERFPAHIRPLRWQNIMDGSGPPHLHGWEGNNGIFRDETRMYGGPDWEQNRQPMNGRGWESGADVWKGQTAEANKELPSTSQKDVTALGLQVNSLVEQASQESEHDLSQDGIQAKTVGSISSAFPLKEPPELCPQGSGEKEPHPSKPSSCYDTGHCSRAYLSKLDVSKELADTVLYDKCTELVDLDHSSTAHNEPEAKAEKDVILIGEKTSSSLKSHPIFIPIKGSLFQRALELYKNSAEARGVLLKKLRALDTCFSEPDKGTVEERVSGNYSESAGLHMSSEEDIPVSDVPTSDQIPSVAVAHDTLQNEMQITPIQALANSANSENSQPNAEGKGDGFSLGPMKQCILSPDVEDTEVVTKSNLSACGAEEREDVGEAMNGLFNLDGSSEACEVLKPESNESESYDTCEALMPKSNEPESVILHRIHHSPESTH